MERGGRQARTRKDIKIIYSGATKETHGMVGGGWIDGR